MRQALLCVVLLGGCSSVQRWGTLREVLRDGDVRGKVRLSEIGPGTYGVGALENLAGEVTVIDGKVYSTRADVDQAAFLVLARVDAWREAPFSGSPEDLRDLEGTVPFLIDGDLVGLEAHVLNGACPFASDPARRGEPLRFSRERVRGRLVGFFTTEPPGVLTHHGSRTHVHVVLEDGTSGHVDRVTVAEGGVLRVPR